jgi:predicted CxxxxCH...CXXCH cytochrome family protein
MACAECHVTPADMFSVGHIDGDRATVGFQGPVSGLAAGTWNYPTTGTPTCSSTYCHGNFANGKTTNAPSWTGTNQAACGTCHNARPQGYLHRRHQDTYFNVGWYSGWVTCNQCHSGIASSVDRTTPPALVVTNGSGPILHVNGTKDVVFQGGGTWDPAPQQGTCSGMACHPGETKIWPR